MHLFSYSYERWLRHHVDTDPRILNVQVERTAEAIRSALYDGPFWAMAAAFFCSDAVRMFGDVATSRCFAFVAIVSLMSLLRFLTLQQYYAWRRGASSFRGAFRWVQYFLGVQFCVSAAWGLGAWLLWDHNSSINHLYVCLLSLSVITRFVVSRAGLFELLVVTLAPVWLLLIARYATDFSPEGLVLGILMCVGVARLMHDNRKLSAHMFQDGHLRFANEDMARNLETARAEATEKRFEAEKANASKTSFLASMSHELRSPLNAILGFSEIIAMDSLGPQGSARYKEYAGDIHSSGEHLLSLINDLLDVAKIEAGRMEIEPQIIEARSALEDALKLVVDKARKRNQTLSLQIGDDAVSLYADERALKQIAINLIANSIKYTPEGGHITVHASRIASGEFELTVEDNGAGIPKEKMSQIFKAFSQIDNRYDRRSGGTGLGLALVRGLTELHGGRTWIESEVDKGTLVHVRLPPQQNVPKLALAG